MKLPTVHRATTLAAVASAFTLTYAASAADIGFVRNPANAIATDPFDQAWVSRLESQGHTLTVFSQADGANPAVTTMDLIIVSQDVASGTAWSNFGNVTKPLLTYEPGIYDEIFGAANGSRGGVNGGVTIVNAAHPLAAGLSGDVSIYTGTESTSAFDVSGVSSGTTVIAQMVSTPNNGIFAVLEPGAIGGGGNSWPDLRMALPCWDAWNPANVTQDGWKLLDGAVVYALTPSAVPEPSTLALLGLGAVFLLARRQGR